MKKKIKALINNTPNNRSEVEVAEEGYGYLRSSIELLVENDIFKGIVKRYQKNVALTNFIKIDGTLINAHKEKLNELFERCCSYISGHSNPEAILNCPTMKEFCADYEEFKKIQDAFKTKNKSAG